MQNVIETTNLVKTFTLGEAVVRALDGVSLAIQRGDTTFADYIRRLERNDHTEWETFVNSLTTNLTSFFREAHHFDLLKQHLTRLGKPTARIWCSAASTGEEPYSIAITCCDTEWATTEWRSRTGGRKARAR